MDHIRIPENLPLAMGDESVVLGSAPIRVMYLDAPMAVLEKGQEIPRSMQPPILRELEATVATLAPVETPVIERPRVRVYPDFRLALSESRRWSLLDWVEDGWNRFVRFWRRR